MMRSAILPFFGAVSALAMLRCPLPAQIDFAALDRAVSVRLSENGQLLLSPDPSRGADDDSVTPLVDPTFARTLANSGVFGWLALVYQGDCDIASMADGGAILRRLDRFDDVSLFQSIQDRSTEPAHQLLRLLAIRTAADRGLRAAIGVLAKELERGALDPLTELAMREALTALGDKTHPVPARPVPKLAELTARLPADPDVLVFVDPARLPSGRHLLRWGREVGIQVTQSAIRAAGGQVSTCTWAGAVQLAEGPSALPYEFARQYGNHRMTRGLSAIRFVGSDDFEFCSALSGIFDVAAISRGLQSAGIAAEMRDEVLEFDLGPARASIGAELAVVTQPDRPAADAERAVELAGLIASDDAPIVIWFRDGAELPFFDELPPALTMFGVPRRIALWLPKQTDGDVKLQITFATEPSARAFERLLAAAPREFEAWLDTVADAEPFAHLQDRIEKLHVEVDGATLRATLPFDDLDLEPVLRGLAEHGW